MAGLNRSQGSKYGMRGVLAATLGFLLGAFGSKNDVDAIKSGNTTGFPLAAKYLRTLNPTKATGRDMGRYHASGTRAHAGNRCPHHFTPMVTTIGYKGDW